MSGIHYVFKKSKKTGELKLLNVTDTIHGAKHIKNELVRIKHYDPSALMIMEHVG
jgi:hypothetical protein